ncbi:DNA polymerase I, partial [Halobacillus litoralis]|nr:DNA polymerase I [Halobacillus litoralis]
WIRELENGGGEQPQSDAGENPNTANTPASTDYHTVLDQEALDAWLTTLRDAPAFAFDTETTSLNYMDARIVGVSFAVESGTAAYVPLGHSYLGAPDQLECDDVLEQLRPLLEDPARVKIGQNLKYDMSVLAKAGIALAGPLADTMLASYVLNSTATRHDMDSLALKYLGEKTTTFEEIAGKGAKQLTFNQIALEQAAPYACEDVDITLRLHATLRPQVEKEGALAEVLDSLELPLVPVLSRMERNGVALDAERLHTQSRELESRIHE